MKILKLFIFIIFLFSCEKEKCKICFVTDMNDQVLTNHPQFEICGDDLHKYDGKTIRDSIMLGGDYRDMSYKIKCK